VTNQRDVGLTTNLVQSPLEDLSGACLETLDLKEKNKQVFANQVHRTLGNMIRPVGICLTAQHHQSDTPSIQTLIQVS
jgi:hypothetical protein